MNSEILNVDGMSCTHCQMTIENNLGDMEGINKVEVNLKNKTVSVEYEDNITLENIKDKIEESGYRVL